VRDKTAIDDKTIVIKKKRPMLFIFTVLILFIVYRFSLFSYFGIVVASDAKSIIRDFEKNYLYSNALSNSEYINLKKNILNKIFTTKAEIKRLIDYSKKFTGDEVTDFSYADLMQGKLRYTLYRKMKFTKKRIDNNTCYIRLSSFGENAENKFFKTLDKTKGLDYLILDLRGNYMGNYAEVISIADDLLPGGMLIASIEFSNSRHEFKSDDFYFDFQKIFIFLDEGSGFGSEMLALTLKENLKDKVELIGKETRGANIGHIFKAYYNKIDLNIASFKWDVKGKNSEALIKYLSRYKDENLKNIEDYLSIAEKLK